MAEAEAQVTARAVAIVRRLRDPALAKEAADELQGWLVDNEQAAVACVEADVLGALHDVLVRGPRHAQADAAWAVNNIVYYDGLKEAAFDVGMAGIMAGILQSDATEAKRPAAGAILGLAYPENLKRRVFEEGAVPGLLAVLRDGPDNAMEGACGALQNISFLQELKRRVFEAGAVPLLLKVLQCGPEAAKTNAAAAMANICIPEDLKQALYDEGVVGAMITILRHGPTEAKRYAAGTLQGIAYLRSLAEPVFEAGAVPLLLGILRDGPADAKGNAAACLGNIAVPDALRKPVYDTGVLPLLLEILRNGPQEAHAGACGAIRSLAGHKDLKEPVYCAGVVPLLVDVLETGNAEAQASATGALLNLANNESNARALVDDALDRIVRSMKTVYQAGGAFPHASPGPPGPPGSPSPPSSPSSPSSMWTDYLGLLYNLSANTDTEHRTVMQTAGVLELVTPSMQSRDNPAAFVTATMCVANLIGHEENHPLLVTDTVLVDELLKVLNASLHGHEYCKATWAVWAPLQGLANLSLNENNKRLMAGAGALEACMGVLRGTLDARAQQYAAKAVSNIAFAVRVEDEVADATAVLETVARSAAAQTTKEFCQLALFQIRQRQNLHLHQRSLSVSASPAEPGRHVMVSFPHKFRPYFTWLTEQLLLRGVPVWMAAPDAHGGAARSSTLLESMALAIREATVVVFCLDASYKESEACRTEGEYALNLHKPMLPLRMDAAYSADGWLGALTSRREVCDAGLLGPVAAGVDLVMEQLEATGVLPPPLDVADAADEERAMARALERTQAAEARVRELQRELQAIQDHRRRPSSGSTATATGSIRTLPAPEPGPEPGTGAGAGAGVGEGQRGGAGPEVGDLATQLAAACDQIQALQDRLGALEAAAARRRPRCCVVQ